MFRKWFKARRKVYPLYLGGKFVPNEQREPATAIGPKGDALCDYYPAAKAEFHAAMDAAAAARAAWSETTFEQRAGHLRLLAGKVEKRQADLAAEVSRSHGVTPEQAREGVGNVIKRIQHWAHVAEHYEEIIGGARATRALGIVIVIAPDVPVLLPMVSLLTPVLLGGNTCVVIPSDRAPLPGLIFAEVLAECPLPNGCINILAGQRDELTQAIAAHEDINAVVDGTGIHPLTTLFQAATARHFFRYVPRKLAEADWFTRKAENPAWVLETVKILTAPAY